MDYEQAVAYMQGLRRFGIKLGNERFEELLRRIGAPQQRIRAVHVAGTKGKGSTTVMVAAILKAHGYHVGGYYSPYVYDLRERVQLDGEPISREDFARIATTVATEMDALQATDHGQTTEFEMKTAIGFSFFAERNVDYAAIEVGLGGRLDATNVLLPEVTVITNIGLDHTQILGDTHAQIAAEKAGIVKPGIPLITAADEPSALEVITRTAAERGAPMWRVVPGTDAPPPGTVHFAEVDGAITVLTERRSYAGLRPGLGGGFQHVNAACAVAAVERLAERRHFEIREEAVREGVAAAYLPGRWDVVRQTPLVILDGAHNAMAAEALAAEVKKLRFRRMILVAGMVSGHDPAGVLASLAPHAGTVIATQPSWMRALPAEEIARAARAYCGDVRVVTPPQEAAAAALREAAADDLVLVTGSFYLVGEVDPAQLP